MPRREFFAPTRDAEDIDKDLLRSGRLSASAFSERSLGRFRAFVDSASGLPEPPSRELCVNCFEKKGTLTCAGCRAVKYCCKECQAEDWSHLPMGHKIVCKLLRLPAEEAKRGAPCRLPRDISFISDRARCFFNLQHFIPAHQLYTLTLTLVNKFAREGEYDDTVMRAEAEAELAENVCLLHSHKHGRGAGRPDRCKWTIFCSPRPAWRERGATWRRSRR